MPVRSEAVQVVSHIKMQEKFSRICVHHFEDVSIFINWIWKRFESSHLTPACINGGHGSSGTWHGPGLAYTMMTSAAFDGVGTLIRMPSAVWSEITKMPFFWRQ